MSGNVFEAYSQQPFCSMKFFPMVRVGGLKVSKNKRRAQAFLDIRPRTFIESTSPKGSKRHKKLTIKSDVYYSPDSPTKRGLIPSSSAILFSPCFSSRSNENMTSRTLLISWVNVLGSRPKNTSDSFSSSRPTR
ncbi:hypothetical protein PILCRDRAFT_818580 [Piloderma croceum F 1598]|uniref:Uncharacterized protein n=1 Tax=Piloderma croceum (strain F 1598) TaxID=765440 RepID=A0A0C3FIQ1_PILCF|nr:hypothetical protein PILCRDRAFT_818580 [Piloderma croceum F 1598]